MLIQELVHQDRIKYSRGVAHGSRFGPSQDGEEDFQEKVFKTCVMFVSIKIFLDKM